MIFPIGRLPNSILDKSDCVTPIACANSICDKFSRARKPRSNTPGLVYLRSSSANNASADTAPSLGSRSISLPKIKNYLSRWVYWWMKTSSCWNYNELVNRYIHSCWNPTAKNRAMGFFQIDEITSSCNDVQACGCKHARPHNKF